MHEPQRTWQGFQRPNWLRHIFPSFPPQVRSPHTPQDAGKTLIVWRVATVVRSDMKAYKRAFGIDKGQATYLNLSDINLSLKMG